MNVLPTHTTAFCFAVDVERTPETASGFRPSCYDHATFNRAFGNLQTMGLSAILQCSSMHLVIMDSKKPRYWSDADPIDQAKATCKILTQDSRFKHDEKRIHTLLVPQTPSDYIVSMQEHMRRAGLKKEMCIFVASHFRAPAISLDLHEHDVPLLVYPTEAFALLLRSPKPYENPFPLMKQPFIQSMGNTRYAESAYPHILSITELLLKTDDASTNTPTK